jgi:hypothetical protein
MPAGPSRTTSPPAPDRAAASARESAASSVSRSYRPSPGSFPPPSLPAVRGPAVLPSSTDLTNIPYNQPDALFSGYESVNISSFPPMWHFREAGIVFSVPPDHARLTIVFDLQADPIAGVVCGDAGDSGLPFAGWMELTRTIERALDAARRPSGTGLLPHDPGRTQRPDDIFR